MENPSLVPPVAPEPVVPPESAAVPPPVPSAAAPSSLSPSRSFGSLLGAAFGVWKKQWLRLIATSFLVLVPFVLAAALIGLGVVVGGFMGAAGIFVTIAFGVVGAFLAAIGIARLGVMYLHLIASAAEGIGLREAWGRSKGTAWGFVWVGLLTQIVVGGGTMLLLVPGIIWSLSFALVPWVFVAEGGRGLNALAIARSRVRGSWWRVFLNMMAMALLTALAGVPFWLIGIPFKGNSAVLGALGGLNGLLQFILLAPLTAAFSYSLYADVRAHNAEPLPIPPRQKTLFVVAALLGVIVMAGLAYGITKLPLSLLGGLNRNGLRQQLPSESVDLSDLESMDIEVLEVPPEEEADRAADPAPVQEEGDMDGDGLADEREATFDTDPANPDTDGDGLGDFDEKFRIMTSPSLADTDGDGHLDGAEILNGYDPKQPGQPISEAYLGNIVRFYEQGEYHEPTLTTLRPLVE